MCWDQLGPKRKKKQLPTDMGIDRLGHSKPKIKGNYSLNQALIGQDHLGLKTKANTH